MVTGGRAFNKTMDAGGAVLGGAKRKVGAFLGAKIPGSNATVGKAALAAGFGGIPGIALYAMHASQKATNQRKMAPPAPGSDQPATKQTDPHTFSPPV